MVVIAPTAGPLRGRIWRALLVSVFLLLILMAGAVILLELTLGRARADNGGEVFARSLAPAIQHALSGNDSGLEVILAGIPVDHFHVCLRDDSGGMLAANHAACPSTVSTRIAVGKATLEVGAAPSRLMRLEPVLVPSIAALLILELALVAYLINRAWLTLVRPLANLHNTAQQLVREHGGDHRATTAAGTDEVTALAQVFDRMLARLESENGALRASEERFRTLTSHAPIGIFQLDRQARLVYANEAWYTITGTRNRSEPFAAHLAQIESESRADYDRALAGATQATPATIEYFYRRETSSKRRALLETLASLPAEAGLIGTLADITEHKSAQFELEKLAFYDVLTGLPNRRYFNDLINFALAKARRGHERVGILMLDIDHFKRVNDMLGHAGGDQLLREQARRIRAAVREQDAVARMGGDEFVILLNAFNDASEVSALANRVLDALKAPLTVAGQKLEMGSSVGIALYPNDGEDGDALLRNADSALYAAKGAGRGQCAFFSNRLNAARQASVKLEQQFKPALSERQIKAYLQPIVDQDSQVIWAEALARWHHREDGIIEPAQFVPYAESSGLIFDLGQLMLEAVCLQLTTHGAALARAGIRGISVNLSGRQFYSRALPERIAATLEEFGAKPQQITFELTETAVLDDIDTAAAILRNLRERGFKIAIDDFGTGYSSLAYVKRLPINSLKIDRSFVADITTDAHGAEIVTTIIAMAHKLSLNVVAEGVETEAQRKFLVERGCEAMQGYLFGKPAPLEAYLESAFAAH